MNNAGLLVDVSKCIKDLSGSAEALQGYFNLNISSPVFNVKFFVWKIQYIYVVTLSGTPAKLGF